MHPTLTKLNLKPGDRAFVEGAPEGFAPLLARMVKEGIEVAPKLTGQFRYLQIFATKKAVLLRRVPALRKALEPGGMLWISYPKGGALGTDLNRDILAAALLDLGLDAVRQVAIDDVWSALRFKAV
jgi:hypothetical protein